MTAARDASDIRERRTLTPLGGTDGSPSVYPFRGMRKSQMWGMRDLVIDLAEEIRASPMRLLVWIGLQWAAALAVAVMLLTVGHRLSDIWVLLGLCAVGGFAERQSVWLTRNIETSISFLPRVFAAVAFGPLAGMLVGLVANAPIVGRPYLKWMVYTPARALSGGLAGLAASLVHTSTSSAFGALFIATLVAAVTDFAVDGLVNVGTLWVRSTAKPRSFIQTMGPLLGLALPLYVPPVALLVYGYRIYSLWVVAAFLASGLAFQRLFQLYHQQREVLSELQDANIRLGRANLSFASALVTTLDARDRYTAGHSAAVAIYARDIAERMGLPSQQQELAHLCGLVHDIGKVGLPPGLLEKSGPLTLEERRQMESHSAIGERILAKVDDYAETARIVRHHHERWDGNGYPDGLAGDEIPVISRIICVADAYNAMTSDRPYRDAMPSRVARFRLAQAAESQFDTAVVAAFEAILAGSAEEYRVARRDDFKFDARETIAAAVGIL
jgi:putative nucleotidyltransferase with HDIG domain